MDAGKVRQGMDSRGWIQADLAERSGVSRATVANLLAGKPVGRHTARMIAQAFIDNPAVLDGWLDRREPQVGPRGQAESPSPAQAPGSLLSRRAS